MLSLKFFVIFFSQITIHHRPIFVGLSVCKNMHINEFGPKLWYRVELHFVRRCAYMHTFYINLFLKLFFSKLYNNLSRTVKEIMLVIFVNSSIYSDMYTVITKWAISNWI